MKTFKDLKFREHQVRNDLKVKRAEELFDNGFGISVIEYLYEDGTKFEIGILEHTNGETKTIKLSTKFDGPLIPKVLPTTITAKMKELQEYLNHGSVNGKTKNRTERQNQQSGNESTTYHF